MPYLYETHMHTAQASACGKSPGRDYIALLFGILLLAGMIYLKRLGI